MAKEREYFRKVRQAREALREKAQEILEEYLATIREAREAGDYEVAAESLRWLMEHMPEDEGERMVDASIDKPKQGVVGGGINFQVGFVLGGIKPTAALPVSTEDAVDGEAL